MKKLTKFLFTGALVLGFAPLAVASLTSMGKSPTQVKALSGDGTKNSPLVVDSYNELKSSLEQTSPSTRYIKLGSDIDVGGYTYSNIILTGDSAQNVYFDLNGHSFVRSGYTDTSIFEIGGKYSLTIDDSVGGGSITGSYSTVQDHYLFHMTGTNSYLTFNNGSFTLEHSNDLTQSCILTQGGHLIINKGSFSGYANAVKHEGGYLDLYGGTFASTEESCIDSYQTIKSNLSSGSVVTSNHSSISISSSDKRLEYTNIEITPTHAKSIEVDISNKDLAHGGGTSFSVTNIGVDPSEYNWSVYGNGVEYTTTRPELFTGINSTTLTVLEVDNNCILNDSVVSLKVTTNGVDSVVPTTATLNIAHKNQLTFDSNNHWWVCSVCGTETSHSEHNWQPFWRADALHHFHACACGAHHDEDAHVDSDNDHVCDVCNIDVHYVSFDPNGGTGTMADVVVTDWTSYEIPECSFNAPVNEKFLHWTIGGNEYAPGDKLDVLNDITLVANWKGNAFTKQPISQAAKTTEGENEISPEWDVNFTASKYEIYENGSKIQEVTHKWFDVSKTVATVATYKVRAFYDSTNYIESEEFTLTWTDDVVTVAYYPYGEGGQGSGDLFQVKRNSSITLETFEESGIIASRGYSFNNWQIGNGSGVFKNPGESITITADETYIYAMFDEVAAGSLVAKYNGDDIVAGNSLDPNDITAILNYEDGSSYELDVIHQAIFYIDSVSIDIENYVFDSVGKITIKVVSEEKETTFNVNVKGFSIVFNANGGSGDDIIVPDIYGDYVLPSCTFTAPSEQKDFAGWKIKGQDGLLAVGSHVNITENTEIIAQWIESNPQSLSATYSGGNIVRGNTINGAYINIKLTYANSTYINVDPLDVEYWIGNSHINDPANYTFDVAQEYSITVKYAGLEATMVVNVVPKQFTVTFAAGEGSGSMAPVTHDEGDYQLPACTFTAPAGKTFDGWQVGGEKKLANEVIQLTENITVTALWKDIPAVTYTVHFDANGGTGSMADVSGQSGDYALPQCDFVAPANKEFKCWSVGGVEKNPGDIIQVTSDVTVTALWKDATPEPVKELTSITLSGTYKTEFEVGDSFSAEGLVVTAHYSDDSSEPIALNNVEITGYNMNQEGKQTVTVSYQGKTATYEITVKAKDTPVTPDDPVTPNMSSGLPVGAVVGIVIGSALVVGVGGFALVWFVIKKKTWADFLALFKKK